jgi:TetR/AcrR family tetracycline transcriptional repressor
MALDRDTVLRAALAVVDEEGVAALSMRRLAADLAVTPMALYNHVRGRADLLDGVADLVARGIERPSSRWGWRRRLKAVLLSTRRACLRHPAAVTLLQDARALTPALLGPTETALEALDEAGLRSDGAQAAWAALISLTFGHVTYQLAGHMRGPSTGTGSFDAAAFPKIAAMTGGRPFDWDRAFARAVDALIDGLVAQAVTAPALRAPAGASTRRRPR